MQRSVSLFATALLLIALLASILWGPLMALGILGGASLMMTVWWVPHRQAQNIVDASLTGKERFEAEIAARDVLLKVIGGAVVLTGLYFSSQELLSSRDQQITDRFSKAVDQLGSKNEDVRIGGIYALERIARDSPRDQWPIIEVLTASARRIGRRPSSNESEAIMTPDVEAVIKVICRRSASGEEDGNIDLHFTVLRGGDFSNAHLDNANFSGALLREANFSAATAKKANFLSAQLAHANMSGAKFPSANFKVANLARAQLRNADLTGAALDAADLTDADLTGAILDGASHAGAILDGAKGVPSAWQSTVH